MNAVLHSWCHCPSLCATKANDISCMHVKSSFLFKLFEAISLEQWKEEMNSSGILIFLHIPCILDPLMTYVMLIQLLAHISSVLFIYFNIDYI